MVRVPHRDVFVRLISFKLKEANVILSEFCGGTQPGDHCLVISVKSTHSNSIMVLFFVFDKETNIDFIVRASGGGTVVLPLQFASFFPNEPFIVTVFYSCGCTWATLKLIS